MWHHGGEENNLGATALAGLTFLECDVPASDPVVQQAAELVRQHCVNSTHTYSISLAIMFLDRLDEEADVILIQSMAVRLLAGQTAARGWTYHCSSPVGVDETRRLTDLLQKRNELKGGREMPKKKKFEEGVDRELPKEIQEQLRKIVPPKAVAQQPMGNPAIPAETILAISRVEGDNSNTQFAALGLWVARRSGMPVEEALMRIEKRFRRTQHQDGGCSYVATTMAPPHGWACPPAMT